MGSLTFHGNAPMNMLGPYLGFESYFDFWTLEEYGTLLSTEFWLRDSESRATMRYDGSFVLDDGYIESGTVTGTVWKTRDGVTLLDWTGMNADVDDVILFGAVEGFFLFALDGDDAITSGGGDDLLIDVEGNDLLRGNGGNDTLFGGQGGDTLEGGSGDDLLAEFVVPAWSGAVYPVQPTVLAGDGESAVFVAHGNLLDGGLPDGTEALFRADLATLELQRVLDPWSPGQAGEVFSLSGDGTLVAFVGSTALAGLAAPESAQLLLADLQAGTVTVVSTDAGGALAAQAPQSPVLSGDGGAVAFVYEGDDLVGDDGNGLRDVYLRDLDSGTNERVSVPEAGGEADGESLFPSLSADGKVVAFASVATNLTADSDGNPAAYVRDMETGELTRIASLAQSGGGAFGSGAAPLALSANGRYVAFVSEASDLVPGDTNFRADVFMFDRASGEIERISIDALGQQAYADCDQPAISADGRFVAFVTADGVFDASDEDYNGQPDVFVRDNANGTITRVPIPGFEFARPSPGSPQLSFDGQTLVYDFGTDRIVLASLDHEGSSVLRGGSGDDLFVLFTQEDTVVEGLNEGFDTVISSLSHYALPPNVEALAHAPIGDFSGIGNALNNRFLGGAGDERWDGAAGRDILTHAGALAETVVTRDGDDWLLEHPVWGEDRLTSVERVEFADSLGLALDTGAADNAGRAFALWFAALDAAPAPAEISPWIADFDAGSTMPQVAQHMLDAFAPMVPGGITDELLVTTLLQHVAPDLYNDDTVAFYVGLLQTGATTQAAVYADAASHPWNREHFEDLLDHGIPYLVAQPFDWADWGSWNDVLNASAPLS